MTQPLDPTNLWQAHRALLDRVSQAFDGEKLIDECLDGLVEQLRADRGLVVLWTPEGETRVIYARAPGRALSGDESEEVSRTLVRQAVDTGRCVFWNARAPDLESLSLNAFDSVVAALAAPLPSRAPGAARGVLYVDFRDPRRAVTREHAELFVAGVVLLGAALEQQRLAESLRSHLSTARAHAVEARRAPRLDEMLALEGMAALREDVSLAVRGDQPVLILGESGTGKTRLAHAIAEAGGRQPVVRAVLGGSDDLNTVTSELFGHERGAFSGAVQKRIGLVEYAHGGTMILDELLNLAPQAQKLLLDFTQFGTYRPLGYNRAEPKSARVHLIAATNGDVGAAIREGRLRQDLFYRLAGVVLYVPPLRERRGDIPALAAEALRDADPVRRVKLSPAAEALLASSPYDWPGNTRELERVVQQARARALVRDPGCEWLMPEHFDLRRGAGSTRGGGSAESVDTDALAARWGAIQSDRRGLEQREREVIAEALARHGGVVAHAAKELGVARTTLASKLEALGLRTR